MQPAERLKQDVEQDMKEMLKILDEAIGLIGTPPITHDKILDDKTLPLDFNGVFSKGKLRLNKHFYDIITSGEFDLYRDKDKLIGLKIINISKLDYFDPYLKLKKDIELPIEKRFFSGLKIWGIK